MSTVQKPEEKSAWEKTLDAINAKIQEASDTFKKHNEAFEAQQKELEDAGKVTEETKSRLETLQKSHQVLMGEITNLRTEAEAKEKAWKEKQAMGDTPGAIGQLVEFKTIGEQFAGSESLKAYAEKRSERASLEIKGSVHILHKQGVNYMERKALSDATVSALQGHDSYRRPEVIDIPRQELKIRDLLGYNNISTGSVEWLEETHFHDLYAELNAATLVDDTTFTLDNVNGFYVGQSITIGTGDNAETRIVKTITRNATKRERDKGTIELTVKMNKAHDDETPVMSATFTWTPRTNLIPSAAIELTEKSSTVKTIGHGIPISRTMLSDHGYLRSMIDNRLLWGLENSIEREILYGTGTGDQIQGICTSDNILKYNQSSGPSTDKRADAIRRAITLQYKAGYKATGVVVSPDDLMEMELDKDSNGRYLNIISVQQGGIPKLWRLPVVESTNIEAGTALVGAFGLGATYFDREEGNIQAYDQHLDYAQRGLVLIQATARGVMTIDRPESFVLVTFDGGGASS